VYTYPFEVEKKTNPDPYSPLRDFYFLRGAWQEWGKVEVNGNDEVLFGIYLTDEDLKVKGQNSWNHTVHYRAQRKLFRDGKLVGAYGLASEGNAIEWENASTDNGRWMFITNLLFKYPNGVGGSSRRAMTPADLKDGKYLYEVTLKHPVTNKQNVWKYAFTVQGGHILPDPAADHTQHKNDLTFLEQGTTHHFVRKLK
jgi:hypothetical protein